ncbi:MAG: Na+/H+ antiporter NhaC family protein [Candidatus Tectimicrobiota bacterium]
MDNPEWLSVLPPLVAILTAIWSKQVFLSLFAGIWLGWTILNGGNPLGGLRDSVQALIDVFQDEGNTRVVAFSALVGSLIAFTQRSGGVSGFIHWVTERGYVQTRRGAQLLAWFLGLGIFVESSITCLVTGAIARPLFDRLKLSREKLAYICDGTSAPVCILLPMNGWGAFILGVLVAQNVEQPLAALVGSILFNFYALLAVAYVLFIVITGKDWGPMARAERRARETGKVLRDGAEPLVSTEVLSLAPKEGISPRARNMLVPLSVMLAMMPVGLWITGNGNLMRGSGSTAVLWAVMTATFLAAVLYRIQGLFSVGEIMDLLFKGIGGLMPLALLMVLAFAIGATCGELGTGPYVASLAQDVLSPALVPLILFWISGAIAFSTGTSWGTFAIMLPIGIPMVQVIGTHLNLTIGAVLAGGIFGDHCSPISDTTIISSMAAGSDHIDHVNTQLPYALLIAAVSSVLFLVAGYSL